MKRYIYADNAATTKLDSEAFEAMIPWLTDCYGNPSVPYSFSRSSRKAISDARETIAKCINAKSDEIFFTSGGTESDNWALKGITQYETENVDSSVRSTVITSLIEHHAILNSCKSLERLGYPIAYLPVTNEGLIEPITLSTIISGSTKLVSIMLANNEIGTIQPIKQLAEIAHKNGAYFHTDAVQAVGRISIDVKELNIDLLSASAHKFHGPKGIGFLYIRNGTNILPYADGGAQEKGFRAGTENVASIVGMAVALNNGCAEIQAETARLNMLSEKFIEEINQAGTDFIINGNQCKRLPGSINISLRQQNAEMLLHRLDLKGIFISTGAACDSKETKVSHVLEAINVPSDYAEGTIRITFGKDNTTDDAISIAKAIVSIIGDRNH